MPFLRLKKNFLLKNDGWLLAWGVVLTYEVSIIPEANHTWFLKRMAFCETDNTDRLSSTPLSIRRLALRQRQDEDNTWVTLWAIQTKNKIGTAIINYLLFIMIHSFFNSKCNPIIFKDSSRSDSYIARQ